MKPYFSIGAGNEQRHRQENINFTVIHEAFLIKVVGVREALPCKEVQKDELKCLCEAHVFLKCLLVLDQVIRIEIKSKFLILRFCRLDLTTGTN